MKHQKLIDRITDIAEGDGWSVSVEKIKDREDLIEFTFGKYSDFGQDFSFSADMEDGDIFTLIENVDLYYDNYDPDEEALLWVGPDGHGKNRAPYRLSDIIKDMEQCKDNVGNLLTFLTHANDKERLYEIED